MGIPADIKTAEEHNLLFPRKKDFRFRGGLVLSYHWFALGVGFGRSDWQRSRVNNVGPRALLVFGRSVRWRL